MGTTQDRDALPPPHVANSGEHLAADASHALALDFAIVAKQLWRCRPPRLRKRHRGPACRNVAPVGMGDRYLWIFSLQPLSFLGPRVRPGTSLARGSRLVCLRP